MSRHAKAGAAGPNPTCTTTCLTAAATAGSLFPDVLTLPVFAPRASAPEHDYLSHLVT
jgi:hypothetical protein